MSKRIRFGALLLCVLMLLSMHLLPCLAADSPDTEYTYTVTLYTGQHGTFADGSDTWKQDGLKKGDGIDFGIVMREMNERVQQETKYYVKGIRLNGQSDILFSRDELLLGPVPVEADAMYVVAYGVQGEQVAYTVSYVDENGTPLLDSQTFYGNPGDKRIVAYQEIEGYEPQAYNLGKTLSENAAENVFEFRYHPVAAEPEPTPTPTPTVTPTPSAAVSPAASPTASPTATAAPEDQQEPEETVLEPEVTTVPEAENNTEDIPENETPQAGPEDYVDLDDNETPLAGPGGTAAGVGAEDEGGLSVPVIVGIACGAGLLLLLTLLLLLRRKNEKRKKS